MLIRVPHRGTLLHIILMLNDFVLTLRYSILTFIVRTNHSDQDILMNLILDTPDDEYQDADLQASALQNQIPSV
ncbi:MAG: hypothetical protein HYY40_14755 [Bacteroidetes bacterium]|nr:hypothetical protein [Bacteroidota bacterium]